MMRLAAVVSICVLATGAELVTVPTDQQIAALEQKLKEKQDDPATRVALAGAFLQKMRESADGSYLDRASRLVDGVVKDVPADYGARSRQLEIEMMRHHFERVIELSKSLLATRADVVVLGLMGDAYMERGEYDNASDTYQKMVDLRPNLASYNRVAFYRFVTGDGEGAIEVMRSAIRMGSPVAENMAWCLADLGGMLFKTGGVADAESAYRQALARFPGYHHALAGLARIQESRGEYEAAIRSALAAQQRAPFPEYTGLLARLYRKTGREDLAKKQIDLLDVADRLERAQGEAANRNLSLAYSDLGYRTDRALELAKAELAVRRDVYTYDALAWALFNNGQLEEARAAMKQALSQRTPEPMFREHAARIERGSTVGGTN